MAKPKIRRLPLKLILLLALLAAAIIVVVVVLSLLLPIGSGRILPSSNGQEVIWPNIEDASGGRFLSSAVVSPSKTCSSIGKNILLAGGSAVDAAIGAALCMGVVDPVSCGLGGGSFLTYYNRSSRTSHALDAREVAPQCAHRDMYFNSSLSPLSGGAAVAVPGEVAGYWMAHQKYGRLPWEQIFQPSIDLCEGGFSVSSSVNSMGKEYFHKLSPTLLKHLTNPLTNSIYDVGENMTWKSLGATLRVLAREGAQAFYNGSLTAAILQDLWDYGSNITAQDLLAYRVEERTPVVSTLRNGNVTVYSLPPPSGGLIVQYILNILDGFKLTKESMSTNVKDIDAVVTTLHRIIESMKFGYGQRMKLGDEKFVDVKEFIRNLTDSDWSSQTRKRITDYVQDVSYYGSADPKPRTGTCHISVIAENGDAAALTSTINTEFGSKQLGLRTGILFNNEMDDFSLPGQANHYGFEPSEMNYIQPGKRPMSSMSPTIILDSSGNVRLVTGGVGGSKIINAVVWVILNDLWFGLSPRQSSLRPRLHHQLLPDTLCYEQGFPKIYLDGLKAKGHKLDSNPVRIADIFTATRRNGFVYGVSDHRGGQLEEDGY